MAATRLSLAAGLAAVVLGVVLFWIGPFSSPDAPLEQLMCLGVTVRDGAGKRLLLDFPNAANKARRLSLRLNGALGQLRCDRPGQASKQSERVTLTLNASRLELVHNADVPCHSVAWSELAFAAAADSGPTLCVTLRPKQHLYGGGATYDLRWPANRQKMELRPFYSADILSQRRANLSSYWGSVIERYWVTADGFVLRVDDTIPLYVSVSAERMCWQARYADAYVNSKAFHERRPLALRFTICSAEHAQAAHRRFLGDHLGHTAEMPDLWMLRSPIWSTWARFKTSVDQAKVLRFAGDIKRHGFGASQVEIDDKFSTAYGDLNFDPHKFPNASAMVEELHAAGFRVTAWVTPFANLDSDAFAEGAAAGAWVMTGDGRPATVEWWQGRGALLDVTSGAARAWFQGRLAAFQRRHGLDGFKFDAGETDYWPAPTFAASTGPPADVGVYAALYARLAAGVGVGGEVRVGHGSQAVPLFVRMFDKHSAWAAADNGLRTLIPNALLSALLGFSCVLPDMIGGNAYNGTDVGAYAPPDRELYVRWLQVTAFMPAMQFSIAPWDFDEEVVRIARKFVELHERVVYEHVKEALMDLTSTGAPVIRPLWWADPTSEAALVSDDQFLVGDCLLVAPVVRAGRRSRDVYVPPGLWRDGNAPAGADPVRGPVWLRDHPAPLGVVPWFECV